MAGRAGEGRAGKTDNVPAGIFKIVVGIVRMADVGAVPGGITVNRLGVHLQAAITMVSPHHVLRIPIDVAGVALVAVSSVVAVVANDFGKSILWGIPVT